MATKDDLLDERIERIRRQNQKIQKRHLEVEADKQYAAKINALVSTTTSDENRYPEETRDRKLSANKYDVNGKGDNHINRYVIKDRSLSEPERNGCAQNKPNFERRFSERQDRYNGDEYSASQRARTRNDRDHSEFDVQAEIQSRKNTGLNRPAKVYTFKEGDGPPPDPAYRFLADSSRDTGRSDVPPDRDRDRDRDGRRNDGGGRGGRPQPPRDSRRGGYNKVPARSQRDEDSRRRYEAWKAERDSIDKERIQRQRTADGHWRREWDNEKPEEEEAPVHTERHTSWNAYRNRRAEDRRAEERNENRGFHQAGAARQGNFPRESPKFQRRAAPVQKSPEVSRRRSNDEVKNPVIHSDRNVTSDGSSFRVCIKNESVSPEPVHKVKVNMPNAAGTGRVGPRQILQPTYSADVDVDKTGGISHIIKGLENLNFHNSCASNSAESHVSPTVTFDMSSLKPPLPPNSLQGEKPKPKREEPTFKTSTARSRAKRPIWNDKKMVNREKKRSDSSKSSKQSESDGENWEDAASSSVKISKQIESDGGDESWEDATTSGTESACEFTEEPGNFKEKDAAASENGCDKSSENVMVVGIDDSSEFTADPGSDKEKDSAAASGNGCDESWEDVTTSGADSACEFSEDRLDEEEEERDVNGYGEHEGDNMNNGFNNVSETVLNGVCAKDDISTHVSDDVDAITNDNVLDCKIKEIPVSDELQLNNTVCDKDEKSTV